MHVLISYKKLMAILRKTGFAYAIHDISFLSDYIIRSRKLFKSGLSLQSGRFCHKTRPNSAFFMPGTTLALIIIDMNLLLLPC